MDEGTFSEWLKNDGEFVQEGEALFVLESDKASQDVESFDAGFLRLTANSPNPGDVVRVGQCIGLLCEEGEDAPIEEAPEVATAAEAAVSEVGGSNGEGMAGPAVRRLARQKHVDLSRIKGSGENGRVLREDVEAAAAAVVEESSIAGSNVPSRGRAWRVSPRAARVAAEFGVDLAVVEGTGKNGRIRERDVLAARQGQAARRAADRPSEAAAISAATPAKTTSLRRTIARRMLHACQQTAAVTLTSKAEATSLVSLRDELKQAAGPDTAPTYTAMLVRLSAIALTRHPEVRHQWVNDALVLPEGIHISVAVDTTAGLIVPVIRDADKKSLTEINHVLRDLSRRADNRTIAADDLAGGVFTISNLGRSRVETFTPVLNMPQAAILGVGRIQQEPVAIEGELAVRAMMALSLTFDHRVIDGAPAARFLDTLCELIERPAAALIG
jgi:pyruvate dehydrogenase E2 component (dihydrolipoamide acetyltransferase)